MKYQIARRLALAAAISLPLSLAAQAAPGSADNGRKLYLKYCYQCHGYEGRGDGPASIYQARRPRDFTEGVYKLKSSPPGHVTARDEDIFGAITNGMPGSGMPRWESILSEGERWDLVAYIKSLSDMFDGEENPPPLDYSGKTPYSEESVERGQWAYLDFKCHECHGAEGQGPPAKILKDDYGYRIWPRDLTKPWTFMGPDTPEALYARITNGIPLTPMPSFVPSGGEDNLVRKRWDVVNYVTWLAEQAEKRRMRWRVEMGVFAAIALAAFFIYAKPVISRYMESKRRSR